MNTIKRRERPPLYSYLSRTGAALALGAALVSSANSQNDTPPPDVLPVAYEDTAVAAQSTNTSPTATPSYGPANPAPGWAECEFKGGHGSNNHCKSFYPTASLFLGFNVTSLSKDCTYKGDIRWGDGATTSYEVRVADYTDAKATTTVAAKLGSHTYGSPGSYSITTEQRDIQKGCNQIELRRQFDLHTAPTPATCENMFDRDKGRVYMYSMVPRGTLKRADGTPVGIYNFDPDNAAANEYIDEAGVKWRLMSPRKSAYHQPKNWQIGWDRFVTGDVQTPYKKFVTETDSAGGSFEAVLMPDGAGQDDAGRRQYGQVSYQTNNWLLRGHGQPTYNIFSPDEPLDHIRYDVKPHTSDKTLDEQNRNDDRYVAATHWIDSTKTDWHTYRERLEKAQSLIKEGYRYAEPNGQPLLVSGNSQREVDREQAWIVKKMSECAG